MAVVNNAVGAVFDVLFLPFRGLSPWFAMIFISLLTAFLMLWIFKLTSNQAGIRKAKNAIKAHLLEMRLYKDNMKVSLRAQGRIFKANLLYMRSNLRPLLVMIIPLVLILAQLNLWFGAGALRPGQTALLKVQARAGENPMNLDIAVEPSGGLAVETPPLRVADEREIDWRIRALAPGPAVLTFRVAGRTLNKPIAVAGRPFRKVSTHTVGGSLVRELLYPGERPLPGDGPLRTIEVTYPPKHLNLLGLGLHWLVAYFILSIVFGFSFKGVFKVEI
jgi:uncharacterized membrane protein (DUF106 family)